MKKNHNKGFALAETLIVSTVVAGILIYLFIQFSSLKRSYNSAFSYNTSNSLYALEDIFDYIDNLLSETRARDSINRDSIKFSIQDQGYVEINNINGEYIDNVEEGQIIDEEYGYNLLKVLNVENILITKEDVSSLNIDSYYIKQGFKTFLSKIKSTDGDNYRLSVHFSDDTYATLIIPMEDDENE